MSYEYYESRTIPTNTNIRVQFFNLSVFSEVHDDMRKKARKREIQGELKTMRGLDEIPLPVFCPAWDLLKAS